MGITLEMFDTLQARMREEEQNSNPEEEWSSVLQRLEKPSDDRVKGGKNNEEEESFHVRDVTGIDGGEGAFSRLHHEMEKVVREGDKIRLKKKLNCNTSKSGS